MQVYENNAKVFAEYMKEFWSNFQKEIEDSAMEKENEKIQFSCAKNGTKYMQYISGENSIRFNSCYNPEREAEIWAKQYEYTEYSNVIIMYGLGSGYFVRALKERMGDNDILLV